MYTWVHTANKCVALHGNQRSYHTLSLVVAQLKLYHCSGNSVHSGCSSNKLFKLYLRYRYVPSKSWTINQFLVILNFSATLQKRLIFVSFIFAALVYPAIQLTIKVHCLINQSSPLQKLKYPRQLICLVHMYVFLKSVSGKKYPVQLLCRTVISHRCASKATHHITYNDVFVQYKNLIRQQS